MAAFKRRLGWWLMGLPVGMRDVCRPLMRWGPYRWGAWLSRDTTND